MYGCDQVGIDRGGCVGALGTRDLSMGGVFGRVDTVSVGQGGAYLLSWPR